MMKPDFPFSGSNPGNKRFSVCSRGAPQGASHVALLFLSSISHHRMEDQWCKHREKCTAPSVTSSSEEDQWCKHRKVHFLGAISHYQVSQVIPNGAHGAKTQKSALSGSHIPAPCVTSSSEEDQWCRHMEKYPFWEPYPCTMCHK